MICPLSTGRGVNDANVASPAGTGSVQAHPRSLSFSGSQRDTGITVARSTVLRMSISTAVPTSASSGLTIASASDFPARNP